MVVFGNLQHHHHRHHHHCHRHHRHHHNCHRHHHSLYHCHRWFKNIWSDGAIWYKSVAGAIQKIRIRDGTIVKYRGESAVSEGWWWWWQNNENDDINTELNCLKSIDFLFKKCILPQWTFLLWLGTWITHRWVGNFFKKSVRDAPFSPLNFYKTEGGRERVSHDLCQFTK